MKAKKQAIEAETTDCNKQRHLLEAALADAAELRAKLAQTTTALQECREARLKAVPWQAISDVLYVAARAKVELPQRFLAWANTASPWSDSKAFTAGFGVAATSAVGNQEDRSVSEDLAQAQAWASVWKQEAKWLRSLRRQAVDDAAQMQNSYAAAIADDDRQIRELSACCEQAEAALAKYKADIPWESMWMYFSHGDYGPDAWQEVDEWLRTNMPQEIARTWLGMPEVQP